VDVVAFEGETVFDIEWLPDASGFLYTKKYVNLGIWTNIFEYSFATGESTEITHLPDDNEARAFSLSPDGQQIVFEWTTEPWDPTSDLYIINRDGTGLRKLVEDAGRPAWGDSANPSIWLPQSQKIAQNIHNTSFTHWRGVVYERYVPCR
jgi:Tol biopolymer transport system component